MLWGPTSFPRSLVGPLDARSAPLATSLGGTCSCLSCMRRCTNGGRLRTSWAIFEMSWFFMVALLGSTASFFAIDPPKVAANSESASATRWGQTKLIGGEGLTSLNNSSALPHYRTTQRAWKGQGKACEESHKGYKRALPGPPSFTPCCEGTW